MITKNITNASRLLAAAVMALLLQACGSNAPGVYPDNAIPSNTKGTLHNLNNELLDALKDDHPEKLENLVSKELLDSRAERVKLAAQAHIELKKAAYQLLRGYYIVNQYVTGRDTIKERNSGINNFDLVVYNAAQEIYIAFFTPKSAVQKSLITAIYYKYDYGWRLNKLEINSYTENGRTAPELMQQAKMQQKNNYLLDASNTMSYAVNCLRPYTNWKYVDEDAIYKYNSEALLNLMAVSKLPIPLKNIASQPRIWRVRIERNNDGAFPNINYISKISLTDTVALKAENSLVAKTIGNVFKGIDKDKKYIYYTIYNETKQGVPFRDHYDIRQKL